MCFPDSETTHLHLLPTSRKPTTNLLLSTHTLEGHICFRFLWFIDYREITEYKITCLEVFEVPAVLPLPLSTQG